MGTWLRVMEQLWVGEFLNYMKIELRKSLSHLYKTQNKKEKTPNLKTSKYDSTVKIVEFDIFFAIIYIRNGINSNNNKKKQHFHFYIDPDYKWLPKNEWTQAIWMCSK